LKVPDKAQPSDEVEVLQKKVEELTQELTRFVNDIENLKRLMGTSKHPSDKYGLGYQKENKHITRVKLHSFFFYMWKIWSPPFQDALTRKSRNFRLLILTRNDLEKYKYIKT